MCVLMVLGLNSSSWRDESFLSRIPATREHLSSTHQRPFCFFPRLRRLCASGASGASGASMLTSKNQTLVTSGFVWAQGFISIFCARTFLDQLALTETIQALFLHITKDFFCFLFSKYCWRQRNECLFVFLLIVWVSVIFFLMIFFGRLQPLNFRKAKTVS